MNKISSFLLVLTLIPLRVHAEEALEVRTGIKEIFGQGSVLRAKLAITEPPGMNPAMRSAMAVLRYDLGLIGTVELVDIPNAQAENYPDPRLELTIKESEKGLLAAAKIMAKDSVMASANLQASEARQLGHKISQFALRSLTGEKGFFTSKIAFTLRYKGKKEIWIADWDGKNAQAITNWKTVSMLPSFSPDGKSIIFTSYKDNNPDLYRYNLADKSIKQISDRQGLNSSAVYDPKGQKIALTLSMGKDPNIYLISPTDGKIIRMLTRGNGVDTSPMFSPNGQEIAFTSDRSGNPQIFAMNADGGNLRRITYGLFWADSADWSNDGAAIAFAGKHTRDEKFQIFISDPLALKMVKLTTDGANEHPTFSPDSRFLSFASNRNGKWEIHIKGVAELTGDIRILSFEGAHAVEPCWSPNLE